MPIRASAPSALPTDPLGLLRELPGTWVGNGFNLIARPNFGAVPAFHLELNTTIENLEFTAIGGNVPNRGTFQPDINLHGLHYLQQVADSGNKGALHIEPGFWMNIPATTDPVGAEPTVIRQAVIPHGDSLIAQSFPVSTTLPNGGAFEVPSGPNIQPVFSLPFIGDIPALNGISPNQIPVTSGYTTQYANGVLNHNGLPPLPVGTTDQSVILDPTIVLRAAISGQNIVNTVVLIISTTTVQGSTGILNIPFVVRNANAAQMDAIFWIETVQQDDGSQFLQLQYVQRVILAFPDGPNPGTPVINWPHISVATLVSQ